MSSNPSLAERSGREASAEELARKLSGAPRDYLAGAVENPALTTRHVLLLLRNRAADETLLQRIGSDASWTSSYLVKRALVLHPSTPHALGLNFIRFLFWKDLQVVSEDQALFPPLRRVAERTLGEKLGEMALGEKITFARLAGRGLVSKLLEETHPLVLEAALWNGRATSSEILAITSRSTSRPEILEAIGRHPRWSTRRDIRVALLRNPRTPVSVSMAFLSAMRPEDLRGIADLPETPRLVKLACRRLLLGRGQPWGGGGSGP